LVGYIQISDRLAVLDRQIFDASKSWHPGTTCPGCDLPGDLVTWSWSWSWSWSPGAMVAWSTYLVVVSSRRVVPTL